MRRLVSTLSPEVALLLERDLLRRGDLHLLSARTIDELVGFAREGAELCLVEALLPDGDALDALDAVRATPEGSRLPVVLVVTSDTPNKDATGFSAMLELPAAPGAVEELLARLLSEPRRHGARRAASARARDEKGAPLGRVVDVSRGGIALRTRKALSAGATLAVTLELPLQETPLSAQVRVLRTAGEHVALALIEPSAALVEALALLIAPPPVDGGMAFRPLPQLGERAASIGGTLAEGPARAALEAFGNGGGARLVVSDLLPFDERALDRWINLLAVLGPVELHGCPAWLRALADRVPATLGRGSARARIATLEVALHCATCGDDGVGEAKLPVGDRATVIAAVEALAASPCFVCGGALELLDPSSAMLV